MPYVAGWDGGGSKTDLVCLDLNGHLLARESFGPLNPNGAVLSEVKETIRSALGMMAKLPGGLSACRYMTVGSAGVSNPNVKEILSHLIRSSGYPGPLSIVGDHEILLYGAVGEEGAVLIAGTGSICIGKKAGGETRRAGGLGYLLGDEGSGYWIGLQILRIVTRALDGRAAATLLTELLIDTLGCNNLQEILSQVYGGKIDKPQIASLSSLLMVALQKNDATALEISRAATEELCILAGSVIMPLGLDKGVLALSGGLMSESSPLRPMTVERIQLKYPSLVIISPKKDASQGAAMMALAQQKV